MSTRVVMGRPAISIRPGTDERMGVKDNITQQIGVPSGDGGIIDESTLMTRLPYSRRGLFDLRKSGKIPFIRLPGSRRILFHWPSVLQALLRQQRGGEQ